MEQTEVAQRIKIAEARLGQAQALAMELERELGIARGLVEAAAGELLALREVERLTAPKEQAKKDPAAPEKKV